MVCIMGEGLRKHRRVLRLLFHAHCLRELTGAAVRVMPDQRQGPGDPREILAAASQIFVWPRSHLPSTFTQRRVTATMARTKEEKSANGHKRHLLGEDPFALRSANERPSKKAKLLDDSDDSDAEQAHGTLKVNEAYANRFEYNKKREEKHRCMSCLPVY